MAYNNGLPIGYNPVIPPIGQYLPPQAPMIMAQQQSHTGLTWVQGEAGAKSFLVGPNQTVDLWDSEAQVIYLKSADASGMPSMKILDYTIRDSSNLPPKTPVNDEYATKNEVETIKDSLKHEIDEIKESLGIE
jgi:hypothetical protein